MHVPEASGWFHVQSTSDIKAPVAQVWAILIDLERYHEWNSFVPSMQSTFKVGDLLTMGVQMNKNRRVTTVETITAIEPQQLLAWKARSPGWILGAERFQTLTVIDAETTRYWTRESFAGVLAPLLKTLMGGDLQRGFDAVARDLKARAEATAN